MKKVGLWVMVMLLPILLVGCGGSSHSSSNSSTSISSSTSYSGQSSSSGVGSTQSNGSANMAQKSSSQPSTVHQPEATPSNTYSPSDPRHSNSRMIIYNAHLSIEVKDYNQFQSAVENDVQTYKGYIVNMTQDETTGSLVSHLTIRVPQPYFYTLLNDIKKGSNTIDHSEISGEDVTKDYIDLGAHLKAKQLVEERLQTFMKKATNTTDLLKISDELGNIESDIESIKGQMTYLENQSSLSTITLVITENTVSIPKLNTKDLNTWQKAQRAFMTTIKGVTTFFSWLLVFLIGASPILLILLIGGVIFFIWRRKRRKEKTS